MNSLPRPLLIALALVIVISGLAGSRLAAQAAERQPGYELTIAHAGTSWQSSCAEDVCPLVVEPLDVADTSCDSGKSVQITGRIGGDEVSFSLRSCDGARWNELLPLLTADAPAPITKRLLTF